MDEESGDEFRYKHEAAGPSKFAKKSRVYLMNSVQSIDPTGLVWFRFFAKKESDQSYR